ncbi:MAG: hypothetical protein QXQ69_03270 [Candidatus Aenigmatarchaeota archaeon]
MSYAIPLIEDLKKKRVRIVKSCGYFNRSNFPENFEVKVLESGSNYDLNITFFSGYPISKAEFDCKSVEIEVEEGIKGIFPHEFDVEISETLKVLVRYFEKVKREEMKTFRDYLKSFGYKSVRFRLGAK